MNLDLLEESQALENTSQSIELRLMKPIQPLDFFDQLKNFLETNNTQDPNLFHYEIARKTLSVLDPRFLANENAIDRLARDLLNHCRQLKEKLIQFYFLEELYLWDHIYLKLLSDVGKTGKNEAKQLIPKLKRLNGELSFAFWFLIQNETQSFHSPAFHILAAVLWKDRIKKWIAFEAANVPALTTGSYHPLRKLLSAQMYAETTPQQVQIIHEENLIGKIDIPTVPAQLMPQIFRGVSKLNSVYGHRVFRFEVQEPFRQMIAGNTDYRVIKLDGGFTELAQRLNLKGKKAITILKEILYAQAHLEFCCQNFSGNFIQLTKYISPHIRKEIGLLITVGTLLLPYQTFADSQKGQSGLLIPLVQEPPLVGSNQYHAAQYTFQMDIMAELSKNSVELAQQGCIHISSERWQDLSDQAGLNPSISRLIHDRWTQDGDDAPMFLQQVAKNHYTLGKSYDKELQFLKNQGKIRIKRSFAGKKSASKREQIK